MNIRFYAKLMVATILAALLFSCNKENTPKSKNYINLSVIGNNTITEDSKDPINVNILLARAVDNDVNIFFELEGNTNDILRIENSPVTIKKGEKEGNFKVFSNKKGILSVAKNVIVKVKSFSDDSLEPFGESPIIVIKPNSNIPELTQNQISLIKGYKDNLNIDLYRIIGELNYSVKITFPSDDKDLFNNGNDTRNIEGKTIITLSEKATADKPIIKMIDNPMGLNDFLYEMLRKETTEDVNESWYLQPYPIAAMKAINFDKQKETFSSTLDNIVLSAGEFNFIGEKTGYSSGNTVNVVPFDFKYSAWDRLLQKAEAGETAIVDDGESQTEYSLSDLITQGASLDPYDYLFTSDISSDNWENEPSDWVAPNGVYNFNNGTFTFTFAFDHVMSYGYCKIEVKYTMHPQE
jgi:hypothetical protein